MENKLKYSYYDDLDIYWSDLSERKQEELKAIGITQEYILDDTIPIGQIDNTYTDEYYEDYEYYNKDDYSLKRTYTPMSYNLGGDDHLQLEDITKLARRVYWLLLKYLPDTTDLPTDMYVGDIIEYLENFLSVEELNELLDLEDTTKLQSLADDINEMFFKGNQEV